GSPSGTWSCSAWRGGYSPRLSRTTRDALATTPPPTPHARGCTISASPDAAVCLVHDAPAQAPCARVHHLGQLGEALANLDGRLERVDLRHRVEARLAGRARERRPLPARFSL